MGHSLRAMTFNTHGGIGTDGRLDLERMACAISAESPDVVALQEVHRHFSSATKFVDQAAWFAERLGMQLAFGANLDLGPARPGAPRRQYGNALLSRYPVLEWDNVLLPNRPGFEQRGLLRIRIQPDEAPMWVYCTHLQHNSATERVNQATAIRHALARAEEPLVLLGDLNATPNSTEVRAVKSFLLDAWPLVNTGKGYTHESRRPRRRIDYAFISIGDIAVRGMSVVSSDASDHLPAVVELALLPPLRASALESAVESSS
ncbi:MAG TPA: endonuclease/exonuclease/phosphatase family protein [Mycobacteriales bacterium]|jgi:endonuclease/exonuclease/phosphatase family metal-dependent hydrolase|nr:endonuclease/exonuclease/phosphatase family protein [Mycobacteriales bacterium]